MKVKPQPTLIAAALALLIFGGGSYLLGWSNLLTVRSIEITGAPSEQAKELIVRSLDLQTGAKLARIDPRSISARLATNNWIQT